MTYSNDVIRFDEQIIFALRTLYSKYGYESCKMSRFERYDLYAANRAFLPNGDIISFTGADGKLMALRPDVTLSIVKNIKDSEKITAGGRQIKLYYNENIYRNDDNELQEQMQIGLENIGAIDAGQIAEVLTLAYLSLDTLGFKAHLDISHMGFLGAVLSAGNLTDEQKTQITRCIGGKNISGLQQLCDNLGLDAGYRDKLLALADICGTYKDIRQTLENISLSSEAKCALKEIDDIIDALGTAGIAENINIDFSVVNDITYYNGIVIQGYIEGVPGAILKGGCYDKLIDSFKHSGRAIGFALNLSLISDMLLDNTGKNPADNDKMLNIALPKGRLGEAAYNLFRQAGFECPGINDESRRLMFENHELNIRYFWVKPSDVATYVERGAADIGVAGKDILLENRNDIYELLDLDIGKCRMCTAAMAGAGIDYHKRTLRVATKYPVITRDYFDSIGQDIDIIKLHGSIELAPVLGLSDIIADLVETGKTLEENNMKVADTIAYISARLIANKSSFKFKYKAVTGISEALTANIKKSVQ